MYWLYSSINKGHKHVSFGTYGLKVLPSLFLYACFMFDIVLYLLILFIIMDLSGRTCVCLKKR